MLYLIENAPCDHGETLFDLAWLWLERRQPQQLQAGTTGQPEGGPNEQYRSRRRRQQRVQLAAALWRLPMAADFLACMAANVPWAAECVAKSPARPVWLPPRLTGQFSFSGGAGL